MIDERSMKRKLRDERDKDERNSEKGKVARK